jgi:hypothetical protein
MVMRIVETSSETGSFPNHPALPPSHSYGATSRASVFAQGLPSSLGFAGQDAVAGPSLKRRSATTPPFGHPSFKRRGVSWLLPCEGEVIRLPDGRGSFLSKHHRFLIVLRLTASILLLAACRPVRGETPFAPGDRLAYDLHWSFIRVGAAELSFHEAALEQNGIFG